MKIGTFVICIFAFALVMTVFGFLINDFRQQYPEVSLNSEYWEKYGENGSLGFPSSIRDNSTFLRTTLSNLQSSESWFAKIGLGIFAIPLAILEGIKMIFSSMDYGNTLMSNILEEILHIPRELIYFLYLGVIILVIFAVISFFQRTPA